jgi:hypothetical protein
MRVLSLLSAHGGISLLVVMLNVDACTHPMFGCFCPLVVTMLYVDASTRPVFSGFCLLVVIVLNVDASTWPALGVSAHLLSC